MCDYVCRTHKIMCSVGHEAEADHAHVGGSIFCSWEPADDYGIEENSVKLSPKAEEKPRRR